MSIDIRDEIMQQVEEIECKLSQLIKQRKQLIAKLSKELGVTQDLDPKEIAYGKEIGKRLQNEKENC